MVIGCQPYAPAAFTPRKYSWYSFLLEAESTPGPQCDRKDFISMKNPLTPAGIESATYRFVLRLGKCVKTACRRNFVLPSSYHCFLHVQAVPFLVLLIPVCQTKRCQIITIFVFLMMLNFFVFHILQYF